jgi:hypothetical protein
MGIRRGPKALPAMRSHHSCSTRLGVIHKACGCGYVVVHHASPAPLACPRARSRSRRVSIPVGQHFTNGASNGSDREEVRHSNDDRYYICQRARGCRSNGSEILRIVRMLSAQGHRGANYADMGVERRY